MVRIHLCPPKIKDIAKLGLFFCAFKRWIRKGSCLAQVRSGAALSAGKNSPVDYFSDAARRIHLCPPKIKDIAKLGLFFCAFKRWIRKGSCLAQVRSGAALSAGKNSPVDYFSDAARRIHLCPP